MRRRPNGVPRRLQRNLDHAIPNHSADPDGCEFGGEAPASSRRRSDRPRETRGVPPDRLQHLRAPLNRALLQTLPDLPPGQPTKPTLGQPPHVPGQTVDLIQRTPSDHDYSNARNHWRLERTRPLRLS
jgi:hypothetical protein